MGAFRSRVLAVVSRIPVGRVATYWDVTVMAGAPRAARAVGNIMRECPDRAPRATEWWGLAGRSGAMGPPAQR